MAQGDLNVANQSGAAFRADLNNQLLALGTMQSGAAEPAPTYAYQLWADTTNSLLKQRNGANNAWITIGTLDAANWGLLTTATASTTYLSNGSGRLTLNTNDSQWSAGTTSLVVTDLEGNYATFKAVGTGAGNVVWLSCGFDANDNHYLWSDGSQNLEVNATAGNLLLRNNSTSITLGSSLASFNSTISLGSSTSGTAGANPKIRFWDNGAGTHYGIGISSNQQDYIVPSDGRHVFYVNGRERLQVRNFGDITDGTGQYPASDVYFGVAAILKGDQYLWRGAGPYDARWTTLSLQTQSGAIGNLLSSWSDSGWGGGANYDVYYGDNWGSSGRCAGAHYFKTSANADGTGGIMGFRILGEAQRTFAAFGPNYGAIPAYFCRAWVSWVGSSGGIRASGNVSSVARNGTGDWTVNFSTAMPDANYSVTGFAKKTLESSDSIMSANASYVYSNTQVRVGVCSSGNTREDSPIANLAVFR